MVKVPKEKIDALDAKAIMRFADRTGLRYYDAYPIVVMFGPYVTPCTLAAHKFKRRLARLEAGRDVR